MSENEKLRGIILEIVREEIDALTREAKEEIRALVKAELLPVLRSAVRESITEELENAAFISERTAKEEKAVTVAARESGAAGSEITGLYLYGIADSKAQTELGEIGIEGNAVYTIAYNGLSAIVHNCPLEPYNSDDEEVVKGWVKTHQHVLDVAEAKFGTIIPFSFDMIIKPGDNANATVALENWISEERDGLMEKMAKIRGKKEYGVQIYYIPSVMSEKIIEENEAVKAIKEELNKKGPGAAYMYKQKLETAIKEEMESRMDTHFKEFYARIKTHVDDIKVEKTKRTDEKDMQMIMNLSCLAAEDKYKALGAELEQIDKKKTFSVRFTGPWPAYSFV
jgi:uncharacterized protein YajQ (UPF0234 family)